MATFNQQGQTVHNQFNADNINFGNARSKEEFIACLKQLQKELNNAADKKIIDGEIAIDAESHITKAILQTKSPQPDKPKLIESLNKAKDLVTSATGLATAIQTAIVIAGTIFS